MHKFRIYTRVDALNEVDRVNLWVDWKKKQYCPFQAHLDFNGAEERVDRVMLVICVITRNSSNHPGALH